MPNHVTTQLRILGNGELVKSVFDKIGYNVSRHKQRTHDGKLVICRPTKVEKYFQCGWLDEETGEFFQSCAGGAEKVKTTGGLPEGWEIDWQEPYRQVIDFNKIIPPPDCAAYRDEPSQEAAQEDPRWWYTWNINNWGTKWNAYNSKIIDDFTIQFDTAWSPATLVVGTLAAKYPELEFTMTYIDEGWNFAGCTAWKDGTLFTEENISCSAQNPVFARLHETLHGCAPDAYE